MADIILIPWILFRCKGQRQATAEGWWQAWVDRAVSMPLDFVKNLRWIACGKKDENPEDGMEYLASTHGMISWAFVLVSILCSGNAGTQSLLRNFHFHRPHRMERTSSTRPGTFDVNETFVYRDYRFRNVNSSATHRGYGWVNVAYVLFDWIIPQQTNGAGTAQWRRLESRHKHLLTRDEMNTCVIGYTRSTVGLP